MKQRKQLCKISGIPVTKQKETIGKSDNTLIEWLSFIHDISSLNITHLFRRV